MCIEGVEKYSFSYRLDRSMRVETVRVKCDILIFVDSLKGNRLLLATVIPDRIGKRMGNDRNELIVH